MSRTLNNFNEKKAVADHKQRVKTRRDVGGLKAQLVELFKSLGGPKEGTLQQIAEELGYPPQSVGAALRSLRADGWTVRKRWFLYVYWYSLSRPYKKTVKAGR